MGNTLVFSSVFERNATASHVEVLTAICRLCCISNSGHSYQNIENWPSADSINPPSGSCCLCVCFPGQPVRTLITYCTCTHFILAVHPIVAANSTHFPLPLLLSNIHPYSIFIVFYWSSPPLQVTSPLVKGASNKLHYMHTLLLAMHLIMPVHSTPVPSSFVGMHLFYFTLQLLSYSNFAIVLSMFLTMLLGVLYRS